MLSDILKVVSANLPIGSFAYSQSIEKAVDAQIINSAEDCYDWLHCVMQHQLGRQDLILLNQAYEAVAQGDFQRLSRLSDLTLALRNTREAYDEEQNKGRAFLKIFPTIAGQNPPYLEYCHNCYLTVYAVFAHCMKISASEMMESYAFAFMEGLVMASIKCVPLGQLQAWQIISRLCGENLQHIIQKARQLHTEDIASGLCTLSIMSAQHEDMYSRIFRS